MALKRAEEWLNSRPPAVRYRQVALLGGEDRKHVMLHFPDAEAVQAMPTAHLLMNTTLKTIQKILRLSSANVAEHAWVLRLKIELTRV
jgi:hypothetical protein